MKWKQRDPYWAESDLGYRVSKASMRYSAWAPPEKDYRRYLGTKDSFDEAKTLCTEHLASVQKPCHT